MFPSIISSSFSVFNLSISSTEFEVDELISGMVDYLMDITAKTDKGNQ
jgi:hypothetical protein